MKALSIRQPWAWLIANGIKDIENRDWPTKFRGPVLIHASSTMTRDDFEACCLFVSSIADQVKLGKPVTFEGLRAMCGGIVGQCEIVDCVTESESPWFVGQYGFVIRNAKPLPFQRCKGMLGFFTPPIIQPECRECGDKGHVAAQCTGLND